MSQVDNIMGLVRILPQADLIELQDRINDIQIEPQLMDDPEWSSMIEDYINLVQDPLQVEMQIPVLLHCYLYIDNGKLKSDFDYIDSESLVYDNHAKLMKRQEVKEAISQKKPKFDSLKQKVAAFAKRKKVKQADVWQELIESY